MAFMYDTSLVLDMLDADDLLTILKQIKEDLS
jgi:hypothetical protein